MKYIKYFIQFLLVIFCFLIFRILGAKVSSYLSGKIFEFIGPFFRSKKIIISNIKKAIPDINETKLKEITNLMWNNYGRVFAEYIFIKDFRNGKLNNLIEVEGENIINEIKNSGKQYIFISGHFSNFELMAMQIEKSGIDLAAVYRPLNNIFLNSTMEQIRKKYICKTQIKKGLSGVREILKLFKNNCSIAMMIDQRVTEGIKINFFGKPAFTTSIPAQLVKKFNCPIVVIYIERKNKIDFEITINKPIYFDKNENLEKISEDLNLRLEKMISNNPEQWIWSHNRWKL